MMVASIGPFWDASETWLVLDRMTIWQAAAAEASLWIAFVGTCITLPFVVGYTLFAYRVFWGKARHLTYGA
jgi:cytochrome bd ubiquinol oxidase subunit II